MNCLGCTRETVYNAWGEWCDSCGGVVIGDPPNTAGAKPPRLFFRHVATVRGKGGHFPIVFDLSSDCYGVAWQRKVTLVKCIHCGLLTPSDDARHGLAVLDEVHTRTQSFCSKRGSLDAMISLIQPIARDGGEEFPSIHAAPSSTEDERSLLMPGVAWVNE